MATITRIELANALRNRFGLTKMLKSQVLVHSKFYLNLHVSDVIQKQAFLQLYLRVALQLSTQAPNSENRLQVNKKFDL